MNYKKLEGIEDILSINPLNPRFLGNLGKHVK
jgi:hypothetical protein